MLEVEDGLDVPVPHVSGTRQKNGWLMQGKAGAPRSFPVLWPRWQADVGCHEGKNGKKKVPRTIAVTNLLAESKWVCVLHVGTMMMMATHPVSVFN